MELLFTVSSFFPLSHESEIVQLFQVYQKCSFWNTCNLNFIKFAVQESEPDLWLTGAIGEHLKWRELWWLAEDQAHWVLPESLFRLLSELERKGLQSGVWLQSLGSVKRRIPLLWEFIFASLLLLIEIGSKWVPVGIGAEEPLRRGWEWLRNKFVWGTTEVEQKVQHISCGGEWVRWLANTKLKVLEPKALNCLFAFPWAAMVPQLLPSGADF